MIDDLLIEYLPMLKYDRAGFLDCERRDFPQHFGDKEKIEAEFIRTQAFYHDKIINEAYYTSNQEQVIQDTLEVIQELIDKKEYITAEYYIVSLQLVIKMDVKLKKIIAGMILDNVQIRQFIDEEKYHRLDGPQMYI